MLLCVDVGLGLYGICRIIIDANFEILIYFELFPFGSAHTHDNVITDLLESAE
jgi:hypothetical protein